MQTPPKSDMLNQLSWSLLVELDWRNFGSNFGLTWQGGDSLLSINDKNTLWGPLNMMCCILGNKSLENIFEMINIYYN